MPAGNEGAALLRVMDELRAELGGGEDSDAEGLHRALAARTKDPSPVLTAADEDLVTTVMSGLAAVAAAAGAAGATPTTRRAVAAALAGVELVIRGELVMGAPDRLSTLMPSFVFVVTLPVVEQDRALELSQKAAELLGELR